MEHQIRRIFWMSWCEQSFLYEKWHLFFFFVLFCGLGGVVWSLADLHSLWSLNFIFGQAWIRST